MEVGIRDRTGKLSWPIIWGGEWERGSEGDMRDERAVWLTTQIVPLERKLCVCVFHVADSSCVVVCCGKIAFTGARLNISTSWNSRRRGKTLAYTELNE